MICQPDGCLPATLRLSPVLRRTAPLHGTTRVLPFIYWLAAVVAMRPQRPPCQGPSPFFISIVALRNS